MPMGSLRLFTGSFVCLVSSGIVVGRAPWLTANSWLDDCCSEEAGVRELVGSTNRRPDSGDTRNGTMQPRRAAGPSVCALARHLDPQLAPQPRRVVWPVTLVRGATVLDVLQLLEPVDHLRASGAGARRLAQRLAVERGKRIVEGAPVVIVEVRVHDLHRFFRRDPGFIPRRSRQLLYRLLQSLLRDQRRPREIAQPRCQQLPPPLGALSELTDRTSVCRLISAWPSMVVPIASSDESDPGPPLR